MTYSNAQFDVLFGRTFKTAMKLVDLKGGEYAGDVDRLANFRRNAAALGLPMEAVWAVYAGKHWDAIQQYCQDKITGKQRERMEGIEGRLDDLIVYCILMKAIVDEGRKEEEAEPEAKPAEPVWIEIHEQSR